MDISNLLQGEIDKKKNELDKKIGQQEQLAFSLSAKPEQSKLTERDTDIINLTEDRKSVEAKTADKSSLERLRTRPQRIDRLIEQDSQTPIDINAADIGLPDPKCKQKVSMQCNLYIHELLRDWSEREYQPSLLLETRKNLFRLLVRLRKSQLDLDLLTSLATVLYHLRRDEFQQAIQSYMKLSIGNVAWPIGVTSVGIHARSAQSRIQGDDNIANIMLDEKTRLWITSIKRLITFRECCHRAVSS